MIDILLMYNLLKALPDTMTLILVGDTDQLPSVGAGNVLKDMIASGQIPVVKLERIFRQAQGSRIIMNAHRINRGESIDMRGGKDSDFFFASRESNEEVVETLIKFCTQNPSTLLSCGCDVGYSGIDAYAAWNLRGSKSECPFTGGNEPIGYFSEKGRNSVSVRR